MLVLHESVILENGLPILVIFLIAFIRKLLDGYLVAIKVLEHQKVEEWGLSVFAEFNVDIRLAGSLVFGGCLHRNGGVGLDELVFLLFGLEASEGPEV